MPVKTTFRGGGGKDREPWNDPSAYTHHYPRVMPAGDGRQVSLQFGSSTDALPSKAGPSTYATNPTASDPWRTFPKGTDTKNLGWKSGNFKAYDDPMDAVKPDPEAPYGYRED